MKKIVYNQLTFKIIVLGDSSVGKTSLINQFVNNNFTIKYKATVGVDLSTKPISVNDRIVQLQIWDPSGSERFRSISDSFFRGTDGYFLICSITSLESFNNLANWLNDIQQLVDPTIPFVALANKCDVDEVEWEVTRTRFENWCSSLNIHYYYVSAKDNMNVEDAFMDISKQVFDRYKQNNLIDVKQTTDMIQVDETQPKKSCC